MRGKLPLLFLALTVLPWPALAQDYPARPVRAIVAVGAGGTGDIFMRVLGEELHRRWGQPVVVENRPGGASNIGARRRTTRRLHDLHHAGRAAGL
jgi:tripartite-type tricarboxylate transporter receptor subunit TctC